MKVASRMVFFEQRPMTTRRGVQWDIINSRCLAALGWVYLG